MAELSGCCSIGVKITRSQGQQKLCLVVTLALCFSGVFVFLQVKSRLEACFRKILFLSMAEPRFSGMDPCLWDSAVDMPLGHIAFE